VPLHRRVDGTLVFVDVSGFTALSERLAQRGKVGAEQLTDVLNTVFGTMLGLAAARGGTLLKFGGDALFLLFTGPKHAVQAACAAVEMRSALAETSKIPSPAGRLRLRMSVGVHTGLVDLFLVGTSHRELVVAGPATTAVAELEAAASAGQILLGNQTIASIPTGAIGEAVGPGRLLRWRRAHHDLPDGHRRPRTDVDVGTFVPTALRQFLSSAEPESEHRTAGVSFIRYTGMDALLREGGPEAAAAALHTVVTSAQGCCDAEDVTFLATDLAEDGGKVILVAGFPTTSDDDQGRLLRATRRIVTDSVTNGWPLSVRAGVNRGHVFAGAIGSFERATVTVMGDTVNLAARVMAKADNGQVLATPSTLDNAQTLFATEPVEPFMVKGKSRPVTAYVVGDETGTRPPRGLGSLPFRGRETELDAILGAVDGLEGGRGAVITVVGDVGMGKTRLLREALSARDTVPSVVARAEPYGASSPYRPLREPLRRLLGVTTSDAGELTSWLAETVPVLVPDLEPWLPLIGDVLAIRVPETPATLDLDPQFRPDRTADVVVQLIEQLAGGPILLTLDDAHYADESTAALMSRLERETRTQPWLLLSTRRAEKGGYESTAGTTLPLAPLATDTIASLVRDATAGAPLRPHEVEAVVSRVAGNPLFLEETLRNLREHGDIDALPASLEAMVAAQIDTLSPLSRRVVRRASVLGRSFRTAILQDLFQEEGLALDAATRRELAEILEPDGAGRLRFRHALLRDAAYDSLPFERRRQFHRAAADSTLRHAEHQPEAWADSLALHYGAAGDHANTWRWARVAAEQARQAFANPVAAAQLERALAAARRLPTVPLTEVLDAEAALGDVRELAGQFDRALDAYRQGFGLAEDAGTRASMLVRMARARERAGQYAAAHRDLTRAQRLLDGAPPVDRATLDARLSSHRAMVLLAQNRYSAAEVAALAALDQARVMNDEQTQVRALQVLSTSRIMLGRVDADQTAREALRMQERLGDLSQQSVLTGNLGGMAWFDGRWDEAERLYAQSAETATRAGNVVQAALAQANQGELLVAQGRLEQATDVLTQASSTLQAVGYGEGEAFARTQLGRIAALGSDVEGARVMLTELLAQLTQSHPALAVDTACALAELEVENGSPQRALEILDNALKAVAGDAGVYAAAATRVRGRALAHLGDIDAAASVLAAGAEIASASGLDYEYALTRLAAEELSALRGDPVSVAVIDEVTKSLTGFGLTPERVSDLVQAASTPVR
jgi:class 3 adenylate cyclase/tetratricopeptide (TPR) repeat protein